MATHVFLSHSNRQAANLLLNAPPVSDYESLQTNLQHVEFARGQQIQREHQPIDHLYFVQRGLVSLIRTMRDGRTVEIGAVGLEGVVGWSAAFGISNALFDAVVQIPGEALRLDRKTLSVWLERSAPRMLFTRYAEFSIRELGQHAACNRLHSLEQRCLRWLLIAADNAGSETFQLTQDFFSMMLGVQRTAVSVVTGALQCAGLIHYLRGRMALTNRPGLEATACECYQATRESLRLVYDNVDRFGAARSA